MKEKWMWSWVNDDRVVIVSPNDIVETPSNDFLVQNANAPDQNVAISYRIIRFLLQNSWEPLGIFSDGFMLRKVF